MILEDIDGVFHAVLRSPQKKAGLIRWRVGQHRDVVGAVNVDIGCVYILTDGEPRVMCARSDEKLGDCVLRYEVLGNHVQDFPGQLPLGVKVLPQGAADSIDCAGAAALFLSGGWFVPVAGSRPHARNRAARDMLRHGTDGGQWQAGQEFPQVGLGGLRIPHEVGLVPGVEHGHCGDGGRFPRRQERAKEGRRLEGVELCGESNALLMACDGSLLVPVLTAGGTARDGPVEFPIVVDRVILVREWERLAIIQDD
jgi:hypothetical protein